MAIKEESLHHATDSLILAKPRRFYPASVQYSHWQLRSLISSPKQNIVYYPSGPSGNEVILLNTKTREREVVAKLPFKPECLTASKDWLCCGAKGGQFVSISLKDRSANRDAAMRREQQVDERLPVEMQTLRQQHLLYRHTPTTLKPDPVILGAELINCITLWSPTEGVSERAYNVPVAVVATNHRMVLIVSTQDSEILDTITMEDFANRSVISPDGEKLITILDDPYLYVHERVEKIDKDSHRFSARKVKLYEWRLKGRILLESQREADKTVTRGSFAACFSPSGRFLAVATQYGAISVFDAQNLTAPDSLLTVFTTSRPSLRSTIVNSGETFGANGAVRSMAFSPAPFDLLAWTEHNGRVGVADVRSSFQSRQLIEIDSRAEGVERVFIRDRRSESPRSDTPEASSGLESRRLRQLTSEMMDRHNMPLTVEELEVLHASRMARRQRDMQRDVAAVVREFREQRGTRSNAWTDNTTGPIGTSSNPRASSANQRTTTAGLPAALREFVNDRSTGSFQTFINERNRENDERRDQPRHPLPRRRSSIILAAVERAGERETLHEGRTGTDGRTEDQMSLTELHIERLALSARVDSLPPEPNPWAEIDALYRSRLSADPATPPIDRTARLRVELAAAADDEPRDFAHRLRQPWRPFEGIGGETSSARGSVDTTGCSWSPDGKILYVGGADGIYEYHVNVAGRKMFPSLTMQ